MKKTLIIFSIISVATSSVVAQNFSFQPNYVEIHRQRFPSCKVDSLYHYCDTNYRLEKIKTALGYGIGKFEDIKPPKRDNIKHYTPNGYYRYDGKGICIQVQGYDKKHTNPPISMIEFYFYKINDTVIIQQDIMIDSLHIDNSLCYDAVISDPKWQGHIEKASKISPDDPGAYILFKNFGRTVTINFHKIKGKFRILEMTVGMSSD